MPMYRVYEVQEEVSTRKWTYVIEAESEDDAIEKAMNGEADPVEQGSIGEPDYAVSGWSVRADDASDDSAWDEAVTDLETRKFDP